jgi:hypothetical protein
MNDGKLSLTILDCVLAVCRLEKDDSVPQRAAAGSFYSITKTPDELSLVCEENFVPDGVKAEKGWRAFKVEGPLDFSLTGVLAGISGVLSEAGISIFAVSTYDTDYILVKKEKLEQAFQVLEKYCRLSKTPGK